MKFFSANNGLRLLFYSFVLASCPPAASARAHASPPYSVGYYQQTVSGTVSDTSGPLPGVSVLVKNSGISTISDVNGNFQLRAAIGDTLVFSFIGYKEVTHVATSPVMAVVLQEDAAQLQELVINAGYYSVKDKERTGSIARITAADIEKQPVTNPLAALQGRMSGVDVVQNTGVSGGGFTIRIRGRNSLRSGGNEPLYIVDGMPFATDDISAQGAYQGILPSGGASPLNGLNPSDIESIEVLKDADATAIYGSRGANGVVLITTKKGKSEKTEFSVNVYTGAGRVSRFMDLMDTGQYLTMRQQAFANDGFEQYPDWAYDVNGTWDQNRYTDWQKELLGGTAITQNIEAGVAGGNEATRYNLRGTTYKEGNVFPGNFGFRKTALHLNLNHTSADKRFSLNLSANYVATKNDLPGTDLTYKATVLAPNAPALYDSNGELNWENSTWENPLAVLRQEYLSKSANLTVGGSLGYRITDKLEFRTFIGYTDNRLEESRKTPHTIYNPSWGYTSSVSNVFRSNVKQQSWNLEPQLNFISTLGPGKMDVLAGLTFQERTTQGLQLSATGFSSNALMDNMAAASTVRIVSDNESEYRYNAVFGRINYNIDGKYILNLTGRRDGSSRFGPGNRFANFGAVGAAWLFSEEKLIKDEIRFLSFGKLRGSYGLTGSDQIGDYQYLSSYRVTGVPYQGVVGLQPARLFNPEFSWETNKKLEVALETGYLNDRLFLTVAHFRNRSSSQLVGIPLPGTTGFPSIQANLDATVQNTGWEFDLRTDIIRGSDLNWTASFNLSFLRNKLLEFDGLENSTYAQQYVIGQPLDIVQVYDYTGVDPDTGLYTFTDYNNDGRITYPADSKKILSLTPDYYGGLQNSLSYKNWQLDFLFQFVKQKGYNHFNTGVVPGLPNNQPAAIAGGWQQGMTNAQVQRYTAGYDNDAVNAFYNFVSGSGVISDASFIRLKNLSLSYTLDQKWIPKASCRLYFQGQNLLTITDFKGADPENQTRGSLPPLRVFSLGIQLNFEP